LVVIDTQHLEPEVSEISVTASIDPEMQLFQVL
jgi:hypothetical protein